MGRYHFLKNVYTRTEGNGGIPPASCSSGFFGFILFYFCYRYSRRERKGSQTSFLNGRKLKANSENPVLKKSDSTVLKHAR